MKKVCTFLLGFIFVIMSSSLWATHSTTMYVAGYMVILYSVSRYPLNSLGLYALAGFAISLDLISSQRFGLQLIIAYTTYAAWKLGEQYAAAASETIRYAAVTFVLALLVPYSVNMDIPSLIKTTPSLVLVWLTAQATHYYLISRSQASAYEIA